MISQLDIPNLPGHLCNSYNADLFFPKQGESAHLAQQICMACPVRAACLQWAIDHDEHDGVWGGMPPRKREKKTRGNAA